MDIDDVYRNIVGEFGSQQKKILFLVMGFEAFLAMHMVQLVFTGAVPDFYCVTKNSSAIHMCPANHNGSADVCVAYKFNSSEFTSIVSQWDLVCNKDWMNLLVQSLFMVGVLLGAGLFGWLADKYGRLKNLYASIAVVTVFAVASSFSPNYICYTTLRVLCGLGCGGMLLMCFVLPTELVGPSYRRLGGTMPPVLFALGIMLFALMAFLIHSWRHLSIASGVPGVLCVLLYWVVPESPRWLLSQGRVADAEKVLEEIAAKNRGKPVETRIRLQPPVASKKITYSMIDLLRIDVLRMRTLVQVFAWFANSFGYYGLTMSAQSLGFNLYINVCLMGLVELPGYVILYFILDKAGRRWIFAGFLLLGGINCIIILLLPKTLPEIVTVVFALLGKASISASFAVAFLYAAELYPTEIRNNGLGACSMAARLGGICAPLVANLDKLYPHLQFMAFGVVAFVAGCISFMLPETYKKPMPEYIEELRKQASMDESAKSKKNGEYRLLTEDGPEDAQNHGSLDETPVTTSRASMAF